MSEPSLVPTPRLFGKAKPRKGRYGTPGRPGFPFDDTSRNSSRSGEFSLSEEEVHRVISSAQTFQAEVLLRVAVSTGIRREDIVRLERSGVDDDPLSFGP